MHEMLPMIDESHEMMKAELTVLDACAHELAVGADVDGMHAMQVVAEEGLEGERAGLYVRDDELLQHQIDRLEDPVCCAVQ
eukprot:3376773-Pleurochrysis_carterae.AAC.1